MNRFRDWIRRAGTGPWNITREHCRGKTVILVTHSREEAERMGKVLRIRPLPPQNTGNP